MAWPKWRDAITPYSVPGSAIAKELVKFGMTHFVTMPDYVQLSINKWLRDGNEPTIRSVECSTEDEAVTIAFGLHVGGKVPCLSMQNQGLFACANALRSAGVNACTPLPILIGQWGRELENLGRSPRESRRLEVRQLEPLLEALEVPYFRLESPGDLDNIGRAIEHGRRNSQPTAILVGGHTSWD